MKLRNISYPSILSLRLCAVLMAGVLFPLQALGLGNWATANPPPAPGPVDLMVLLTDGTVMAQQTGVTNIWYRLTPDIHGSYINGTWTTLPAMIYTRQYYSSAILRDGRFFVAGGEYGTGGNKAEIFDTATNAPWAEIPVPAGLICTTCASPGFSDSDAILLQNGNVLIAPVIPTVFNGTVIYNPSSNTFTQGPAYFVNQNEATWVKLPDDSILTIDPSNNPNLLNTSERYIPSLNNGQGGWIPDANLTVPMYNSATEIGAGLLLHDGRAFFIGGNGRTAYYSPSGGMNNGTWAEEPALVSPGVGWDEPAALMPNGKVLIQTVLGPPPQPPAPQPRAYYEIDPVSNTVTETTRWADGVDISGYAHMMLVLPDGNVLVSYGSSTVRLYLPDGVPDPAGKPTISSISANADGSFHLIGTQLNGLSQGSSFGDDAQMDTNYPIVRIISGSSTYYGRTYNWSSTGVRTGSTPVSTEFTLPAAVYEGGGGTYSLEVVANGIKSDAVTFTSPVWVDFNYTGFFQLGTRIFPYKTLAQGVSAVVSGGTIFVKGPGASAETFINPPISKSLSILAIGGAVTVGQ